jgi:hypothetical protein
MMTDDSFSLPGRVRPHEPRPPERLFEFCRDHDRYVGELHDFGAQGVEARVFKNLEMRSSRRFDTRGLAAHWAAEQRRAIERAGA